MNWSFKIVRGRLHLMIAGNRKSKFWKTIHIWDKGTRVSMNEIPAILDQYRQTHLIEWT